MLSIFIVFPDGLKQDRFVLWIIEIGNFKNMENEIYKMEDFVSKNINNISVTKNIQMYGVLGFWGW